MALHIGLLIFLIYCSLAVCDWTDEKLCGLYRSSDVSSRIFNGSNVYLGEYPWVVHIRFKPSNRICTGGILSPRWILTAAHCLYAALGQEFVITYGRVNPDESGSGGTLTLRGIDDFNLFRLAKVPPWVDKHDVGLIYIREGKKIKLPRSLSEIKAVNSMCLLPPTDFMYPPGEEINIAGYGLKGEPTPIPELLTKTSQRMGNEAECKIQHPTFSARFQFCYADPMESAVHLCGGDSGAPVNTYYNATELPTSTPNNLSLRRGYTVGIHVGSGRDGCGPDPTVDAGYRKVGYAMRVDYYKTWIDHVISVNVRPKNCVGLCSIA